MGSRSDEMTVIVIPAREGVLPMPDSDSVQTSTLPSCSWCDWLPPKLWVCPRCLWSIETREAAPRCRVCGYQEGT